MLVMIGLGTNINHLSLIVSNFYEGCYLCCTEWHEFPAGAKVLTTNRRMRCEQVRVIIQNIFCKFSQVVRTFSIM